MDLTGALSVRAKVEMGLGRDSGQWKTGRFGPIGPETAQCQLPHNTVTFGMVPETLVCYERGRKRDIRDLLPRILSAFYLLSCYHCVTICLLFINYISSNNLIKIYIIFKKYFLETIIVA